MLNYRSTEREPAVSPVSRGFHGRNPPGVPAVSSNAGAGTEETDRPDLAVDQYDEMLETLDTAIGEAARKVESGRVYDAENEKVRIKWIRALAYAVNVRRQVQNDRDLEAVADRLERLEGRLEERTNGNHTNP